MNTIQRIIEETFEKYLNQVNDKSKIIDEEKLLKKMEEVVQNSLPEFTEILYESLTRNIDEMYNAEREIALGFESRLEDRWYQGLALLKTLVKISEEVAMDEIDNYFLTETNSKSDQVMRVLFKLHSKAVQMSKEIFTLLKSGFADGAMARWRSLHEHNVIFRLLIKEFHNLDFTYNLVNRYLDYSEIERAKEIFIYKKATNKLDLEPLEREEVDFYKRRKEEILSKYEKGFDLPNMWSKPLFRRNVQSIKFYQLESLAEIDNLNPYYNQANYQVHASPKGIFESNSLIADIDQKNFYNFGSTNYGLSLPGQLTAISLTQITIGLITLKTNIDKLVLAEVLLRYSDECKKAFHTIQEQIEFEENEINENI
jgi:hypothetical protein